jgi:hypothetical protein
MAMDFIESIRLSGRLPAWFSVAQLRAILSMVFSAQRSPEMRNRRARTRPAQRSGS